MPSAAATSGARWRLRPPFRSARARAAPTRKLTFCNKIPAAYGSSIPGPAMAPAPSVPPGPACLSTPCPAAATWPTPVLLSNSTAPPIPERAVASCLLAAQGECIALVRLRALHAAIAATIGHGQALARAGRRIAAQIIAGRDGKIAAPAQRLPHGGPGIAKRAPHAVVGLLDLDSKTAPLLAVAGPLAVLRGRQAIAVALVVAAAVFLALGHGRTRRGRDDSEGRQARGAKHGFFGDHFFLLD